MKLSAHIKFILWAGVIAAIASSPHFISAAYAQDTLNTSPNIQMAPAAAPNVKTLSDSIPVKRAENSGKETNAISYFSKVLLAVMLLAGFTLYFVYKSRYGQSKWISFAGKAFARMEKTQEIKAQVLSSQRLVGDVSVHVINWRKTDYLLCCCGNNVHLISTSSSVTSDLACAESGTSP